MKTKIIKSKGYYKLVVNDDKINNSYPYVTKGKPIVLATLTNFADSEAWILQNIRLQDVIIPSSYLLDNNVTIFDFKNKEKHIQKQILEKIHTYSFEDNNLFYNRFTNYDLNGDIPKNSLFFTKNTPYPKFACFTFKEGMKNIKMNQDFWNTYNGDIDSADVKISNQHIQPHESSFAHLLYLQPKKKKN